jgi:zinc transport system substrate-binding protein
MNATATRWIFSAGLLALGVGLLMSGCGDKPKEIVGVAVEATGGVAVDNYPLSFFAETVLGGTVPVTFLAPPDEDPAFWEPDDAALTAFQSAKVILLNGAGYSKWVEGVSLPQSRVVETTADFASNLIEVKDVVTHSHGPKGEHAHTGTAFTTWLDLRQAAQQLEVVTEAVLRVVPEAKVAEARKRAEGLKAALAALDARLEAAGKRLAGRPLLGSHPVYQYLARRYGLSLVEVHWEPDVVPDEVALGDLKEILAEHPAAVMLWEGEPAKESVAVLKKLGIASVVVAPCGNRPASGDFLSVMESNVKALEGITR